MSNDKNTAKVVSMLDASVKTANGMTMLPAVPLKEIHADLTFNVRKTYHGIDSLAADMRINGQITPLTLAIREDGKPGYDLISGFRRFQALKLAEIATAAAVVKRMTKKERNIFNIVENEGREGLSAYDLATKFFEMSEMGMAGTAIAASIASAREQHGIAENSKMGSTVAGAKKAITGQYVNNLVGVIKNVHPSILLAWKEGHPAAKVGLLVNELKSKSHEEQLALWAEVNRVEAVEGDAATEGNPEALTDEQKAKLEAEKAADKAARVATRATKADLDEAVAAVKWCMKNEGNPLVTRTADVYQGILEGLRFGLGKDALSIKGCFTAKIKAEMKAPKDE